MTACDITCRTGSVTVTALEDNDPNTRTALENILAQTMPSVMLICLVKDSCTALCFGPSLTKGRWN